MENLKELQTKKQNIAKAKSGWNYISSKIVNKDFNLVVRQGFSELLIDDVLIALVFNKRIVFQGYFNKYYSVKEISFLEKAMYGVEKTKSYNQGSNNNGHKFERTVAFVLRDLGFKVSGIKCVKEFPEVVDEIRKIFVDSNKIKLSKIKDKQNAESISGDFIGEGHSISCKYNNEVMKHPSFMKVFSMACGVDRESFISLFPVFNDDTLYTKLSARKKNGMDSIFAKEISKLVKEELSKLSPEIRTENVIPLYDFLLGKDRPVIIIMKPDNTITVKDISKIDAPTDYEWIFNNDKMIISFNNGIQLIHRFKCAINSSTKTQLSKVYKEEWKLFHENAN